MQVEASHHSLSSGDESWCVMQKPRGHLAAAPNVRFRGCSLEPLFSLNFLAFRGRQPTFQPTCRPRYISTRSRRVVPLRGAQQ